MREIKFRAWTREEGEKFVMSEPFEVTDLDGYYGMPPITWADKDEIILMQYTGLKDKNGKEIYEGDVVVKPYIDPMGGLHSETEDGRYQVGFKHGQFVIYMTEPRPLIDWCNKQRGEYVPNYGNRTIVSETTVLEVIGNIYENPDLLQ